MAGTDDQQRRRPVAIDFEGDIIDQLGHLLSDAASIAQWIGTIPWEKWVGALVGPAVLLVQPALQRYFPRWGTGSTVLIAHAQRGATWPQYAFLNMNRTFTPLVLGTLSAMTGMAVPALALLSYGLTGLIYYGARQKTLRHRVEFCRNQFRLNRTFYRYSDLTDVRDVEGGRELRWKKYSVRLTTDQYEKIRQSILEQGWGAAEEHRPSLDLR